MHPTHTAGVLVTLSLIGAAFAQKSKQQKHTTIPRDDAESESVNSNYVLGLVVAILAIVITLIFQNRKKATNAVPEQPAPAPVEEQQVPAAQPGINSAVVSTNAIPSQPAESTHALAHRSAKQCAHGSASATWPAKPTSYRA